MIAAALPALIRSVAEDSEGALKADKVRHLSLNSMAHPLTQLLDRNKHCVPLSFIKEVLHAHVSGLWHELS